MNSNVVVVFELVVSLFSLYVSSVLTCVDFFTFERKVLAKVNTVDRLILYVYIYILINLNIEINE